MSMNNLLPELEPYKDKIPEFILKLYHILEKKDHAEYLTWFNDEQIVVKNCKKFEEKVLPQYFRHKHLASFIRQLNMYKFSKVSKILKEKNHMYFRNEYFQRGNIEKLLMIKRNIKKNRTGTEATIPLSKEESFDESDNVSIKGKLLQNDKSMKELEDYKVYVKKSASRIKQLIGRFASNSVFEPQMKSIASICDQLMQAKKDQVPSSFGLSSSHQSYNQMTFLNCSQNMLPKIQGQLIFPSQCSLSNFNSFKDS